MPKGQANIDVIAIQPTRRSVYLTLIAVALLAIIGLFLASLSHFKSLEIGDAETRLALYERSLKGTLERFEHLPYVLARDPMVMDRHARLNHRLAAFAEESRLEAIYLMDTTGTVLAASNHATPLTFMGENYGFRPYFKAAMAGKRGEFFGVGATTGRPGYFISEPVIDDGGALVGVIAIKLDMSELQKAWEEGGENVLVSNADTVVVLSSKADWRYRTLVPLTPTERETIRTGRQFGAEPLDPLDWQVQDENTVRLSGEEFVYAANPVGRLGWQVHYLLDESRVYERATLTTILFGVLITGLLLLATFLRSVRIRAALEAAQADRAELIATNDELKDAQEELSRSSKLAALGHLAASVTHELGQPISALRNHLTAAEIGGEISSPTTVSKLNKVLDRMDTITRQLRFFAKPGNEKLEEFAIQDVWTGTMDLVGHDLQAAGIDLTCSIAPEPVRVLGNKLRLEQVLVNLVTNSMAAMEGHDTKRLAVTIGRNGGEAFVSVEDDGQGFGDRALQQLQEPFHTTRASGDGMGLGLSIASAIIREHQGSLEAETIPTGGARFTMTLPARDTRTTT
ncbi:MAG: ATP-binding protein [Pseudomonadota bacterium]